MKRNRIWYGLIVFATLLCICFTAISIAEEIPFTLTVNGESDNVTIPVNVPYSVRVTAPAEATVICVYDHNGTKHYQAGNTFEADDFCCDEAKNVTLRARYTTETLPNNWADPDSNFQLSFLNYSQHQSNEVTVNFTETESTAVMEKVAEICEGCREEGLTSEYDTAVWLHDWLTANADYDETYTWYVPEGVLLYGTGVCESYTLAYQLLLNEMGIENCTLAGTAGEDRENHIWNVVKLDGVWCQIDVTWDDPKGGGAENHNYFGLTDELMARDHFWNEEDIQQRCTSLDNYYPQRAGALVYTRVEDLEQLLNNAAEAKQDPIELIYVGTDAGHQAFDAFQEWYRDNGHSYGMSGYGASFTRYGCIIHSISYTEPWEQPVNHLENPVTAPDFTLTGPEGRFSLSAYDGNGLVLVFLPEDSDYTTYVLDTMSGMYETLRESGVEMLVMLKGRQTIEAVMEIKNDYQNFRFCYDQDALMWSYIRAVIPTANSIYFPVAFVINGEGKIIYYSSGSTFSVTELQSEALTTGSSNPLPEPAEFDYSTANTGGGTLEGLRDSNVKTALVTACANNSGVFFVTDTELSTPVAGMLNDWEANYALYRRQGYAMVACLENVSEAEKASYPHVSFVSCDFDSFVLDMLYAVGHSGTYYDLCSYYLDHNGIFLDYATGTVITPKKSFYAAVKTMSYEAALPAGLTTLEGYAFADTALHTVDLTTARLTSIPANAFAGCTELEYVKIPDSVTDIAPDAFADCPNIVIVCSFNSSAADFAYANGLPLICP